MQFQPGNQLWKLRSKHGRDKLFATPELLWEAAVEYFNWCDENPVVKQDFVGKDGDQVERKLGRPYTQSGLCVYLDCSEQMFRDASKRDDFFEVCTRISQIIKTQKFDGAAVGIFNANIIARDLGLKDQTDVTSNNEQIKFNISLNL